MAREPRPNARKLTPGMQYNHWTLIERLDSATWIVECDCGTRKEAQVSAITTGRSKRCIDCARKP